MEAGAVPANIRNVHPVSLVIPPLGIQPPNTYMRETTHATCYSLCTEIAEVRRNPSVHHSGTGLVIAHA